ncbi:diflavin oxidoreductase [Pseudoflavitalea rhizosphaerae]|uniref:diflavin oxidoreductase n=1 Tax=Pseudoflavitalea rhizosphaerae TaxID=1884793 RepID=UPI000F8DD841|nr:flavodoxin domain-containing protein [Pseudoflavitalea rhizosphaerae]
MLVEPKLKTLLELVKTSSREELVWMNGYLAGLLERPAAPVAAEGALQQAANIIQQPLVAPSAAPAKPAVQKITLAYGTETGNSKKLAADFAGQAKKAGINAKLVSLDQYRLNDLSKEEYFFAIISTQGDGEPPATAKKFFDHIHQNGAKLQMKFGVLALGDTSYPLYCKAGEDVDAQLQKLGGQRIVPLQKCDTDYESDAGSWFNAVLQSLSTGGAQPAPQIVAAPAAPARKSSHKKLYSGTVLSSVNLNDRGSAKETYHIEIGVEEDVDYLPGDSIGIVPENPAVTVAAILNLTGIDPKLIVNFRNEPLPVEQLLRTRLNIVYLPERVVNQYAKLVQQDIPATRIGLLDLLKIYPVRDAAQFEEVVALLEPITPRLYSISSSPAAHDREVHLTVARDTFYVNDECKYGLCSDYLAQQPENGEFDFYVHRNNQFRLPDTDTDVIMIGPGTGIAPFRSFLWERDAAGGDGRNWLFFGEQHFVTDFLYQTEIQNWLQTGTLHRLSLAFSRDQQYKVYVQHRILEEGRELWKWIEKGAWIYLCGTRDPMSTDVEYAILQVIERFGGKGSRDAINYLEDMKAAGRFLKDVY